MAAAGFDVPFDGDWHRREVIPHIGFLPSSVSVPSPPAGFSMSAGLMWFPHAHGWRRVGGADGVPCRRGVAVRLRACPGGDAWWRGLAVCMGDWAAVICGPYRTRRFSQLDIVGAEGHIMDERRGTGRRWQGTRNRYGDGNERTRRRMDTRGRHDRNDTKGKTIRPARVRNRNGRKRDETRRGYGRDMYGICERTGNEGGVDWKRDIQYSGSRSPITLNLPYKT